MYDNEKTKDVHTDVNILINADNDTDATTFDRFRY